MTLHKEGLAVRAGCGETVYESIRQAAMLALEQRCPVTLEHNGTFVRIDPKPMLDAAAQSWDDQRAK